MWRYNKVLALSSIWDNIEEPRPAQIPLQSSPGMLWASATPSACSCCPLFFTDASLRSTPQEIFCVQLSISESSSREPNLKWPPMELWIPLYREQFCFFFHLFLFLFFVINVIVTVQCFLVRFPLKVKKMAKVKSVNVSHLKGHPGFTAL